VSWSAIRESANSLHLAEDEMVLMNS